MTQTPIPAAPWADAVDTVDERTRAVRGHLEADRAEEAIAAVLARGEALRALRNLLPPDREDWPDALVEAVAGLRDADRTLEAWILAEHAALGDALGRVREQATDTYREDDAATVPGVFDRHG